MIASRSLNQSEQSLTWGDSRLGWVIWEFLDVTKADFQLSRTALAEVFSKNSQLRKVRDYAYYRPKQARESLETYAAALQKLVNSAFVGDYDYGNEFKQREVFRQFIKGLPTDLRTKCMEQGLMLTTQMQPASFTVRRFLCNDQNTWKRERWCFQTSGYIVCNTYSIALHHIEWWSLFSNCLVAEPVTLLFQRILDLLTTFSHAACDEVLPELLYRYHTAPNT